MSRKFIKFTEINDHEGETWFFWLQVNGNEEELDKLRKLLDEADNESYGLDWKQWDEVFIDFAEEEGGWGYMNYHNKVVGNFTCPVIEYQEDYTLSELCDNFFYKGGIEDYFKED
jgi:hypothetical protein